jgi:hypothetical protein
MYVTTSREVLQMLYGEYIYWVKSQLSNESTITKDLRTMGPFVVLLTFSSKELFE